MILPVLHAAYVLALVWYLCRRSPPMDALPEDKTTVHASRRIGVWVRVLVVALVFVSVVISSESGMDALLLFVLVSTVWILTVYWRGIRLVSVIQGVAFGLVALAAGMPAHNNGLISDAAFYLLAGLVPFLYIAGGLLTRHTRMGGIQLQDRGVGKSMKSFTWGCLLFVPLGLFNVADGPVSGDLSWVTEWWMPLTLPWFSGIAEEALFRLFIMSICFFLLRPAFKTRLNIAVLLTVLFSATTFGLLHGRDMETFVSTGFLYGAPMAVVFARRDWEHAVGAHYMINMPSWVVAFLGA